MPELIPAAPGSPRDDTDPYQGHDIGCICADCCQADMNGPSRERSVYWAFMAGEFDA